MRVSLGFAIQTGFWRFVCAPIEGIPPEFANELRENFGSTVGHIFVEPWEETRDRRPCFAAKQALWYLYASLAEELTSQEFQNGLPEYPQIPVFLQMADDLRKAWEAVIRGDTTVEEVENAVLLAMKPEWRLTLRDPKRGVVLEIPTPAEWGEMCDDLQGQPMFGLDPEKLGEMHEDLTMLPEALLAILCHYTMWERSKELEDDSD